MTKSWFYRMLLSYLPVFFILTTILFILFFGALNEQNRRDAMKANAFLARQALQYVDGSLRDIDYRVTRDILNSKELDRFFTQADKNDVYDNIVAVKAMKDLKLTFPIIHSIYFVRYRDGFVLSDKSSGLVYSYADSPFIHANRGAALSGNWTGVRTFREYASDPGEDVITLARGVPYFSASQTGLFVVNVNLSELRNKIDQMYDTEISFVHIFDLMGNNLLEKPDHRPTTREVFASFKSEYTGWQFESGLINGGIIRFMLDIYNVWFVFAMAVVLAGVGWVIYVTRRNYKPIRQIVTLIQSSSGQRTSLLNANDKNEFLYIQSTLERMMEQAKKVQRQSDEDLPLRRKYFFLGLLEGTRQIGQAEWSSQMQSFGLPDTLRAAVVFVVEIDDYAGFRKTYGGNDEPLLKFVLSTVVQETVDIFDTSAWTEWVSDRRMACVLWLPDNQSEKAKGRILEYYRVWVERELSFTVTVGTGTEVDNPSDLRASFRAALLTLDYKAVLGKNRIIRHEPAMSAQKEMYGHMKAIHALVDRFRICDEGWKEEYSLFFTEIRRSVLPRQDVVSLMRVLIDHLDRAMTSLSKEYQDVWKQKAPADLQYATDQWDTLEEAERLCLDVLDAISSDLMKLRDSKQYRTVIREVRKYIEDHYANPNLSLDHLSEVFHMNGKYLSKLFKDEFGEKFVDFLMRIRIENAKRQLLDTKRTIQEISESVGYPSYISFNRVFKNVAGMSPGEFRKRN
ncbi:helix-turn-helix domain-containing protein [Paenibacillus spongiae]|uniref:Helix-turn-helix domain-containing protein n=1 Tax=Paenibacillus spongiae TaxID=2909671 RepID=A0ABY5S8D7_9BACL|nr:helix-turn-helix domain-containing protein [Paenibacillus spongiae]UVI30182.1 helix-turn-helix domain-containing protein [Paenibacillus spongiae]